MHSSAEAMRGGLKTMTEITIENGTLVARMIGIDALLAVRRKVTVPLSHIMSVEETADVRRQSHEGWKLMGGYFPGSFRNGTFRENGRTAFWNVTGIGRVRAVTITLHDDRFSRLVLAVRDPEHIIAMIRATLPVGNTSTTI